MKFTGIINSAKHSLAKHSPEILTGIGIAGMISAVVMAATSTPKALTLFERERDRREKESENGAIDPISNKDKLKIAWKCYVPCAVTVTVSASCIIFASVLKTKRNAALATAYTLSESALREYQRKVIDTIGEKKEEAIRDSIAKDKIDENPVSNNEVVIIKNGDTLFYDVLSGRYFKSDIDKINKAVNKLNRQMISDMYISLNDFYYEIGLKSTKIGSNIGWNIDRGLIELKLSAQLTEDEGPCVVIDYSIEPNRDYMSM